MPETLSLKNKKVLSKTLLAHLFVIFVCFLAPSSVLDATYSKDGPVVLIVGTRPEAIKMALLYEALKAKNVDVKLCVTGQHAELLDSALAVFDLTPDYNLKVMSKGQDLFHVTQSVLQNIKQVFDEVKPRLVVVQGDTTSAMSCALAAFYKKIPVAHVEAGLRTHNIHSPYPEEMNRRVISVIASYHFTPTEWASSNLILEGIDKSTVFCTGNTIVDALYKIRDKILAHELFPSETCKSLIKNLREQGKKVLLLTAHRRESFDSRLLEIFSAIKTALQQNSKLHVIYVQHPNPSIQEILKSSKLNLEANITILPAVSYLDMVYLLTQVNGIATDSGGIQEEAVSLNQPVLILRQETDRPEAVLTGQAVLVGSDQSAILHAITKLLNGELGKNSDVSIYGDGKASERITEIIKSAP